MFTNYSATKSSLVRWTLANTVQTTGYYPSGTPYRLPSTAIQTPVDGKTDRLHIGNKWLGHSGLAMYDNTARLHDPLLMRYAAPDPLYAKFGSLSPWSHCASDPLNHFDPDGRIKRDANGAIIYTPTKRKRKIDGYEFPISTVETELGNSIDVCINRNKKGELIAEDGYTSNCHGFAFLDNFGWIDSNEDVNRILEDEYKVVNEPKESADVKEGLIVVYSVNYEESDGTRNKDGDKLDTKVTKRITAHTAKVVNVVDGQIHTHSDFGNYSEMFNMTNQGWLNYYKKREGEATFYRKKTKEELKKDKEAMK